MSKGKGKFRMVQQSFWTDPKVIEDFTPEDKLFFLYLMTNPATTQIGIYSITKKQMAYELGYSPEVVAALLVRFETHHEIIKYDQTNRELFIINWGKHNYRSGGKPVEDLVRSELSEIKNLDFIREAASHLTSDAIRKVFEERLHESSDESLNESYHDRGYKNKELRTKNQEKFAADAHDSNSTNEQEQKAYNIINYLSDKIGIVPPDKIQVIEKFSTNCSEEVMFYFADVIAENPKRPGHVYEKKIAAWCRHSPEQDLEKIKTFEGAFGKPKPKSEIITDFTDDLFKS